MNQTRKSILRQTLRAQRQSIIQKDRAEFSSQAAQYLQASHLFQQSEYIACYFSTSEEFDTQCLIEIILNSNKKCYLPILSNNQLFFVHYQKMDELQLNQFKILEPKKATEKISLEQLQLILLPLVGFDKLGHRLGMGGGYYDRTFYSIQKNANKKMIFLGVGFSLQEVELLPHDKWDILLDGVLTEKGIVLF